MEQRTLGKSGIRASRIGLGCATFGREIQEETAFRIMDYAVQRGITLFDTAEAYGGGQARQYRKNQLGIDDEREVSGEMHSSERIIGRWLRSSGARNQIVLLTKVTTNFTRRHVREALNASLDRLQTDAVDLYLYHSFDANTPVEEAVEAMGEVLSSGQARVGGCSNYTGEQLEATLPAKRVFEVIESNYNLVSREIEQDILPLARPVQVPVVVRAYQALPDAKIDDLIGLVSHLDETGGRQDLPVLARDLQLEVDDLLPLIEGMSILGLGEAQEGDAVLSELGREFAAAEDVQEQKQIFRAQVMHNVELIHQIMDQLRGSDEHSFKEDALLEQLQEHFSEPEARRQLDTAIDWGRFAELFAYDDDTGELYLEQEEASAAAE